MVSIPPGSALGRYRVIEQLGRGGMATVFRCHDPTLDRYVAIKVLPSFHTEDPSFVGRFAQEAQTIASLSHPNILQVFDFGEDKGFSYIVSELVLGGDLQGRLKGDPLEITQVLKYMRPLADGLDYAHGQGIVHRDLKPANILLTEDDRPILADFGLARMLESAVRFTQASQALGTPEYMSPEQAMGADADHRSDLYAFGILIYQMLLGETPFRADTPAATLMAHVHQPLPLPTSINPDIEPRLEATILKSLAKEPNDRFQSARDMIEAIEMASGVTPWRDVDEDLGATAVLDTEAPTAILGATPPSAAGRTAVLPKGDETVAPAKVAPAPEKAELPPKWILAGAGATAAVVVAILAALVFMPGGADEVEDGPADTAPSQEAPPGTGEAGGPSPPQAAAPVPQSTPTPELPPTPTVDPLKVLDQIQELASRAEGNVVAGREITIEQEILTDWKSREDLEKITRGFFRRPELHQQVIDAQELYKALGLMDEEQDLEDILLGIQLQQVVALFDDESEKVYVLLDASNVGPKAELGMASAYMGGIQQALFDIAKMRERARSGGSDEFRAVNALIGGDVA